MPVAMYPLFLNAPGKELTFEPKVSRKEFVNVHTLVVSGLRPDMKEFLDGEQTPCWT
jgi:hypothetical protein